MDFCTKIK